MRTVEQWFGEYGASHTHPGNELLHFICVPAIVMTVVGFLWAIPVPDIFAATSPWLNWATLMVGAIYWNGDGVAKDDAAAAHWFEIADLAGESRAAKMLGDEAFGRLVKATHPAETDAILDVAIGWYEKAVEVEPMPEAKAQAEQSLAMLSDMRQKLSTR